MTTIAGVLLGVGLLLASGARATTIPGGGPRKTDCLAQLSAGGDGYPAGKLFVGATCVDGAACDLDGQVNGVCVIPAAICLGMATAGCTPKPVANLKLTGSLRPKGDGSANSAIQQQVAALADAGNVLAAGGGTGQCTAITSFSVPVVGPNRKGKTQRRQLRLKLRARGQPQYGGVDRDTYRLVCLPGSAGTTTTTIVATSSTTTTVVTTTTTSTTLPSGPPGAGLKAQITGATIDGSGIVTVTFSLTDDAGVPLIPVAASTTDPTRARVRFTIARLETVDQTSQGFTTTFTRYRNYITRHVTNSTTHLSSDQPTLDSGGTFATVDAAAGIYTYTFNTALPQGYPATLTHRIGGQVGRTYSGASLTANPIFDFVPAGGAVTTMRELVTTAQCNACHDPLAVHGGGRREVRLCQTCHTDQAIDVVTGNTIDFKVMIHRIHDGKDLPSINAAGAAVGTKYGISNAVFAEKVKACVGGPLRGVKCDTDADCGTGGTCTGTKVDGVGFPQDIRNCTKCHGAGATVDNFRTKPSAATCTSCHDDVNPGLTDTAAGVAGIGHEAGPQPDALCTVCHKPTADVDYDITIPGAHTVPEQSSELAGLNAEILTAVGVPAGQVTITFKLTDGMGAAITDLSGFSRVAFAINGPTSPDFGMTGTPSPAVTPTAVGSGSSGTLTGPDGSGVFTYVTSVANSLPGGAAGTWRVGIEARRSVTVGTGPTALAGPKTLNEAAQNAVLDFSVDSSPVQARRTVVDIANCQHCHGTFSKGFSIHGNLRNQTQYCVLCHNPSMSDFAQRKTVANADANDESIDLKHLIHKIHTGENLAHAPYIIYGFGGSPNDFSEVRFPGDRRDCAVCHTDTTYLLPLPAGVHGTLLTQVNAGVETPVSTVPPIQDACLACHDADDVAAHAETNTTAAGAEACTVCHGEGAIVSVSEVHATGP